MIQLVVQDPTDRANLAHGDMKTLDKVLDKEIENMKANLVEASNPDLFRFHQGVAQGLMAVQRLINRK